MENVKRYLLLALLGVGLAGCIIHDNRDADWRYRPGWVDRGDHSYDWRRH